MEIELPENLKTERLLLKKISMEDKNAWMKFMTSEDAMKYISFIELGEQGCVDWINRQLDRYDKNMGGLYGIYKEGVLIGQSGLLVQEVDGEEVLEIGYHIIPEYWGNGYAFEAAKAWKYYAFQNRLSKRLVSIIDVGNNASIRVAEKNGMKALREARFKGLNVIIYAINYSDWLFELDPDEICQI